MLNKLRLLTPGPTPLPEPVRLALAQDMIHHRKGKFKALMGELQPRLQLLFGTAQPVLPLACSGTGAMTAAVYSLFRPGERVVVIEGGKFGERWTEMAKAHGLEVIPLEVPWGEAIQPERVRRCLQEHPEAKGVLAQLSETSTGVLHPVQELAAITRDSEALLVVDGISAVGISPCPMDEWGIDCLLTGSQKGLMLPPGLALIALSPRAWAQVKPDCYYFDLLAERQNVAKGQTHFTSPINLVVALDVSLQWMLADGLEAIYSKQWALTCLVRRAAAVLGLPLLAKSHYSWGLTAIKLPDGVAGGELVAAMEREYGVVMAGGQDQLKGKIVRLGHMGWVDWGDCIAGLSALKDCLARQGVQISAEDFVAPAMAAYSQALDRPRADGP